MKLGRHNESREEMGFTLIIGLLFCLLTSVTSAAEKPNIVFIMADDLGWKDVEFAGATFTAGAKVIFNIGER